jgi:HSP20 family protein
VSSLSRFHTDLDRLFDEVLRLAGSEPRAGECQPCVDVLETEGEVILLVEVPGVDPADLEVTAEGRAVIVTGRKRSQRPEGAVRFHRVEREEGRFERRIELLQPVNTLEGRARTEGGVLVIAFPRVAEKRVRRHRVAIDPVEEPR